MDCTTNLKKYVSNLLFEIFGQDNVREEDKYDPAYVIFHIDNIHFVSIPVIMRGKIEPAECVIRIDSLNEYYKPLKFYVSYSSLPYENFINSLPPNCINISQKEYENLNSPSSIVDRLHIFLIHREYLVEELLKLKPKIKSAV